MEKAFRLDLCKGFSDALLGSVSKSLFSGSWSRLRSLQTSGDAPHQTIGEASRNTKPDVFGAPDEGQLSSLSLPLLTEA